MTRETVWRIGVAVAAALGLAQGALAGDWNTGVGGNAARNSLSTEIGPSDPDVLWEGSVSAVVAQQGVTEGNLFVVSRMFDIVDVEHGTLIVAHDLTTGEQLWDTELPVDFPGTSWRSRVSAIRDGQIYATRAGNTNLDYLYALDPADGSIIWQSEDLVDEGSTESLAFTDDGDVIAGNFFSLLRISRVDGATVWDTVRSCPTSNGCQAAVFGDRVYVWEASFDGPMITAFDAVTGAELYSGDPIGGGFIEQIGPLVGPDGTVYAPRSQNNPITDFFVAYEDTGTALVEKWRVPMGYVPFASFGVGPDGSVYTYRTETDPEDTVEVVRLDPADGAELNTSGPLAANFPVQPRMAIDADGKVYVTNGGFSEGRLYSLNADLTFRWSVDVPNVNVGGPALGQGGILVVCGTGTDVRAFRDGPAGDVDGDGDADLNDYRRFRICLTGPGTPVSPGCQASDIDEDTDADLADFSLLANSFTGAL